MIFPVHHTPGRLRVKSPLIKDNPRQAEVLCRQLQAIAGVHAVTASPVTGSAVIKYAPDAITAPDLFNALDRLGYPLGQGIGSGPQPVGLAGNFERLGEKIVESLVQTMVERSAVALVTALI